MLFLFFSVHGVLFVRGNDDDWCAGIYDIRQDI